MALAETSTTDTSETSPLLPQSHPVRRYDPNAEDGSSPVLTNGTPHETETTVETGIDGENAHENSLEQQNTIAVSERQKQYEGLPEVKKQLPIVFSAVALGVFLSAADQTLIVSSYSKIGSELHALSLTSWIASAYFLTLTSFQPLYGKLSDIFGRKTCLLFGYVVFGLGCLGCGLAQDMKQLIGARAFAGIGGAAMTTVVSILLSDICTLRERGQWQGYVNIVYAAGSSAGAPLGGFAADYLGWRWAFLIQVPMCLLAFIAVLFALKLPRQHAKDWKKMLRRIDFPGAVMLIGAVFTLILALDRGSNVSWKAPITGILFGISIPLFAIFIVVETKLAVEPFAPGHIIFSRSMFACYMCNFLSIAGQLGALFFAPLYFQTVDRVSATGAGLRLIPAVLASVSGSLFAGAYMKRIGRYYKLTVVSCAIVATGSLVSFLCSGAVVDSVAGIVIGLGISGFGGGSSITTTLIALIANASREDQAVVTACSYMFRSLGAACGVSLSATVANQALRTKLAAELPKLGLPEGEALKIADRVRQSLAYLSQLSPKVRAVVEKCFAHSTTLVFGLQLAFAICTIISAFFIREKALSK